MATEGGRAEQAPWTDSPHCPSSFPKGQMPTTVSRAQNEEVGILATSCATRPRQAQARQAS